MKIFLDDIREAPEGWKHTDNVENTIKLLLTENVSEISLDHDLGDDKNNGTGYDVLTWVEEQVFLNDYVPPTIHIHTSNPSARLKMKAAVKKIRNLYGNKTRR